jgi:dihydroorotate dehydrogenase electron transfer subunit
MITKTLLILRGVCMGDNRNEHRTFNIKRIEKETPKIKTFYMDRPGEFFPYPGSFMMVWLPGIDEKPFTVSSNVHNVGIEEFGITVKRIDPKHDQEKEKEVGKFTRAMHEMGEDDSLYIRGPYGKGFRISDSKDIVVIGGGCGIASLAPLTGMWDNDRRKKAFLGAVTEEELFFTDRFERYGFQTKLATDDGSNGYHGFLPDLVETTGLPDDAEVFICGPEPMMKKAAEIASRYTADKNIQLAVERYVKCANAKCGQCEMGGSRVCVNGPVYTWSELKNNPDFAFRKRNKMGRYEPV